MRYILMGLFGLFVAGLLLMKPLVGLSPLGLRAALDVGTGLGAKLACSHRYLTGLSPEQIREDLVSYSPAFASIALSYDDEAKRVRADISDWASQQAQYRPGLGCTLENGDTSALDAIEVPELARSDAPWPAGEGVDTLQAEPQQRLDAILKQDGADGYQTRALLVVKNGAIVGESYIDGTDAATPHLGWSMAKSVTAMLLGLLEQDGAVAVSERGLFPLWRQDERADINLENLLRMASGLDFDEEYIPGSDSTRMLFASRSAAAMAMDFPLAHVPGTYFSYSSGTSNLLALLFTERAGGSAQAVSYWYERLLRPLGMAHTTFELDPSGVFVGSSYIYATARDWARLGQFLLDEGRWNGEQLLPDDWVDRASAPNNSRNDGRYGYQFWLNQGGEELRWPDLPADAYAMQGNRGQVVMMVPSRQIVIVRLGWSADSYPRNERFEEILRVL